MQYRISIGSVTYAIKGRDILRRNGYKVKMERSSSLLGTSGCGYSLIIDSGILKAEEILQKEGVKIISIDEM